MKGIKSPSWVDHSNELTSLAFYLEDRYSAKILATVFNHEVTSKMGTSC